MYDAMGHLLILTLTNTYIYKGGKKHNTNTAILTILFHYVCKPPYIHSRIYF